MRMAEASTERVMFVLKNQEKLDNVTKKCWQTVEYVDVHLVAGGEFCRSPSKEHSNHGS